MHALFSSWRWWGRLVACMLLASSAAVGAVPAARRPFYGYSWSRVLPELDNLATVSSRWIRAGEERSNDLRWNALMTERTAAYLNQALYDPIRAIYPDVTLSNYGHYYHSREFGVPDRNGRRGYLYGNGAHVGTHQAGELYARLGRIMWRPPEGVGLYPLTPFNGFRHALNRMRAMTSASDVPVYPWLAFRGFSEGYTGVANHDLYQELIFHAGLCGPDAFLFWNPRSWKQGQDPADWADDDQDRIFSACLHRLTELAGYADREPLAGGLVPWSADFALSGMRAGGRTVWRFTPQLEDGATLESTVVRRSPATFRVGPGTLLLPGGRMLDPDHLSDLGCWIVAPADVEAPQVK